VSIHDYWSWLEDSFASKIRAQPWYNGAPPRNLSGFINDKSNRLIGWVTMRQLRIKSGLCRVFCSCHSIDRWSCVLNLEICPQILPIGNRTVRCKSDYSRDNEERGSFSPGWSNGTNSTNTSTTVVNAFQYRSSEQLDTYLYIGEHGHYASGGFVYEFRGGLNYLKGNLSELHRFEWIDDRTRAIIIQMSLYNPNIEMFTSGTFLVECLSTGNLIPTARFEPLNLQSQFVCSFF
jgi:hypothetical protein